MLFRSTCCPRIHKQQVVFFVIHHLADVGMSADKKVRRFCGKHISECRIIPAGASALMGYQYINPFAVEAVKAWIILADVRAVNVSVNGNEGLGFPQFIADRSEERRVGKECRSRGSTYH